MYKAASPRLEHCLDEHRGMVSLPLLKLDIGASHAVISRCRIHPQRPKCTDIIYRGRTFTCSDYTPIVRDAVDATNLEVIGSDVFSKGQRPELVRRMRTLQV